MDVEGAGDKDVSAFLASCRKPPGEKEAVLLECGSAKAQVLSRASR